MPPPAEGLTSRLFLGPTLRAQPDRRLVTLVREGYEAAFEEIVRRYGRPLGRYAASIVGGRSEDVLQDAFAKALPALQRDDAEIDLRPWLFRIVRNTALNDLRDSPPSAELLAETLAGGDDPADELVRRERLAELMRRLGELPEPQRAAIVMRELEGLGHAEIAAALGLSGGGARQAIYRARQALREGAALLLPLPLMRLLIDHGAETAAGAGAGGALAAAGASAGGAGVGGALKLGVVAAAVAGSVGAGVAAQQHRSGDGANARAASAARRASAADDPTQPSSPPAAAVAAAVSRPTAAADRTGGGRHDGLRNGGPGAQGDPRGLPPIDSGHPLGRGHGVASGHGPAPGRPGRRHGDQGGHPLDGTGPHRGPGPGGRGGPGGRDGPGSGGGRDEDGERHPGRGGQGPAGDGGDADRPPRPPGGPARDDTVDGASGGDGESGSQGSPVQSGPPPPPRDSGSGDGESPEGEGVDGPGTDSSDDGAAAGRSYE